MSTSIQKAVEELREDLSYRLKDRNDCIARQGILNLNLTNDLHGTFIMELPKNFGDSFTLFSVFFERISHSQVTRRLYPHDPIVFSNIFMAIKKFKARINVFKTILNKTCQEYFHYEALFAVLCHVLHHPVYFNHQSERFFILKCMIITRIEQRRQFPPKPDSVLTHLCDSSLDKIIELMFKNHGMKDREETRQEMGSELRSFNTYWNEIYSESIRLILQSDPKFFEKWEPALKKFFSSDFRCAEKEKLWFIRLERMFPEFWKALRENKVSYEAISWILYWYVRHTKPSRRSLSESETFSELMTRLVQPGQMSFPFREHPKLDFALRWGIVLRSDLMEICSHLHLVESEYVEKTP
jgi:hypothetical protein